MASGLSHSQPDLWLPETERVTMWTPNSQTVAPEMNGRWTNPDEAACGYGSEIGAISPLKSPRHQAVGGGGAISMAAKSRTSGNVETDERITNQRPNKQKDHRTMGAWGETERGVPLWFDQFGQNKTRGNSDHESVESIAQSIAAIHEAISKLGINPQQVENRKIDPTVSKRKLHDLDLSKYSGARSKNCAANLEQKTDTLDFPSDPGHKSVYHVTGLPKTTRGEGETKLTVYDSENNRHVGAYEVQGGNAASDRGRNHLETANTRKHNRTGNETEKTRHFSSDDSSRLQRKVRSTVHAVPKKQQLTHRAPRVTDNSDNERRTDVNYDRVRGRQKEEAESPHDKTRERQVSDKQRRDQDRKHSRVKKRRDKSSSVSSDESVSRERQKNKVRYVETGEKEKRNRVHERRDMRMKRDSSSDDGDISCYNRRRESERHERGNKTIQYMKPSKYSGATSIETFLIQFNLCAEYNKWSKADSATQLKCCLTGIAAQMLWDGEMIYLIVNW
jgi:hypothetical protein